MSSHGDTSKDQFARWFLSDWLGTPKDKITDSEIKQFRVMMEALEVFVQRNRGAQGYRDLWKDYGWSDTIVHLRSKAMRVVKRWWGGGIEETEPDEDDLDDVFDLINYAIFFIRNVRLKNRWGTRHG